jgi:hypothetical protein
VGDGSEITRTRKEYWRKERRKFCRVTKWAKKKERNREDESTEDIGTS